MAPRVHGVHEARRRALRQILRRHRSRTQEELVQALAEDGFRITQSSLSRDLAQIGALKVDGVYRLESELGPAGAEDLVSPSLAELQPFVRSLRAAGPHLLVVLTRPGLAQTVALALDSLALPEVVGTVAGDDTVFVATTSGRAQRTLRRRFGRDGRPDDSRPEATAPAPAGGGSGRSFTRGKASVVVEAPVPQTDDRRHEVEEFPGMEGELGPEPDPEGR
jgi:transcriptional regulator of arginine metabolism